LIDLHTHTAASDGDLSPTQLVRLAETLGLEAIAITDHDTIHGVCEWFESGQSAQLEVVPGIEFGAEFSPGSMHVLAYYYDPRAGLLRETLDSMKRWRNERNPKIVARLRKLGSDITFDEVLECSSGDIVGRVHIATVLFQKGFVRSMQEAFDRYIGKGKPAYVQRRKLAVAEIARIIHELGGVAVLAHPKSLLLKRKPLKQLIVELHAQGLDGIEALYSDHTDEETEFFLNLAKEQKMLVTGGSDFHGKAKPHVLLGRGFNNLAIPYHYLEEIKKRCARQLPTSSVGRCRTGRE
jgi:predicted metal-dependent phosphoesterase TrpH